MIRNIFVALLIVIMSVNNCTIFANENQSSDINSTVCENDNHDFCVEYEYLCYEKHQVVEKCKVCGYEKKTRETCSIEIDSEEIPATNTSSGVSEAVHCTKCGYKTEAEEIKPISAINMVVGETYRLTSDQDAEWIVDEIGSFAEHDLDYYLNKKLITIEDNILTVKEFIHFTVMDKKTGSKVKIAVLGKFATLGSSEIEIIKGEEVLLPLVSEY